MKWLTGLMTLSLVVSSVGFAGPFSGVKLDGKDLIRIEIGSDEEEAPRASGDQVSYLLQDNRRMRTRIRRLEQAMRQMQDQIYRMEDFNSRPVVAVAAPVAAKEYTCYIKTTFKGTVFGKGTSEAEARAKALQSCDSVGGASFDCDDDKVKCGN